MSLLSSLLGRADGMDPRTTHRLYKVPVTITIEIPVVAPSPDIASDPDVLKAALPHIISDLESAIGSPGQMTASIGPPSVVIQISDLPSLYAVTLPYEHPLHPTSQDLDCREWLSSSGS